MSRGLPRHCLSLPSKTNAPFHPVLGAPGARRRHHAECYQQPSSRSKLERPRGRHRPATEAQLTAYDVALDRNGNIYISDTENQRIRKVDKEGIITTVAGSGDKGYSGDGGPATEAALEDPVGVAVDGEGNLYFADHHNSVVRKVDPSGTITTFAGTGEAGFNREKGPATEVSLNEPWGGPFVDGDSGVLYIADTFNARIRAVRLDGS